MPYSHQINYTTPEAAAKAAKSINKRVGTGIAGFRTVLGKYRPGSSKSEMERAHERDKKRTDMKDGNLVTRIGEASVGMYSNTTPALSKTKDWKLDINYVSEEGTYSSYKLSPTSAKLLHDWMKNQGVDTVLSPSEFHVTLLYSSKDLENYKPSDTSITIPPKTYEWKILGNPPALVLGFYSETLNDKYKMSKMLGAQYTFPYFIQHITVTYEWDYTKDTSQLVLPVFPITLVRETVKPLREERVLSRLPELKQYMKRNGWQHRFTNSRDEMIFVKGSLEIFLLPEPSIIKQYAKGLKGYMSGPAQSKVYQWKLVGTNQSSEYGMTAVELDAEIKSIRG